MPKKSTILITGGAGFIGSHLARTLLKKGHKIIVVDNLLTGSIDNIRDMLGKPRFKFVHHDIIEPLYLEDKINQIYNLACPASPVHYQYNAIRTIKANTIGVINILGLAKAKKARILQASTSEVYGNPDEHPQKETYQGNVNPIGPRACYDEGKRCAETLFFDYYRAHNLEIKIARIFNTYGPGMAFNDGRVVSNFILQALKNEDITVYGTGKQTRSFCYIDDLVGGLIKLMNSRKQIIGPINLGNPEEYTIKNLAKLIIKLTNSESKIVFKKLPADDPQKRQPNISQAKKLLKWEPQIDLKTGLELTIKDFQERLSV